MDRHLKIATWINLGIGGLVTLHGLGGMLVGIVVSAWEGDPESIWLHLFIGFILGVPGLPWLVGGVGLLKGKEWGRRMLVVLSFVALLFIPLGTAVGGYTLWVLMNPETRRLLALGRGRWAPAPASGAYDPAFAQALRADAADYAEPPRPAG
jgi:hypothetical protein